MYSIDLLDRVNDAAEQIFVKKTAKHLIVSGSPGTGKTSAIKQTLQNLGKTSGNGYSVVPAQSISLAMLYVHLYSCRKKGQILWIDDVGQDKGVLNLLKQAMDWQNPIPTVTHNFGYAFQNMCETSGIECPPTAFEFEGHIIIDTSIDLQKSNIKPDWVSLKNRALYIPVMPVTTTQIGVDYKSVFQTQQGQAVLYDLERIVNQTKISADDPNPNTAVWKCAQQALIQRIHNQLAI